MISSPRRHRLGSLRGAGLHSDGVAGADETDRAAGSVGLDGAGTGAGAGAGGTDETCQGGGAGHRQNHRGTDVTHDEQPFAVTADHTEIRHDLRHVVSFTLPCPAAIRNPIFLGVLRRLARAPDFVCGDGGEERPVLYPGSEGSAALVAIGLEQLLQLLPVAPWWRND